PMQFGDSLEQFAKAFANKDEDGTFRYEPTPVDESFRDVANETTSENWFNTESAPEIAKAVAEANAVANRSVDDPTDVPTPSPASPSATSSSASSAATEEAAAITRGEESPSWPTYGQPEANQPAQPATPQQKDAET
ncbi:MAG: SPFH/Band 7/PHB domain protein, partial [Corynebacterium sp.]|nr:SPFH/Band 7/PHB domain protein [Corynebacterium sp.]